MRHPPSPAGGWVQIPRWEHIQVLVQAWRVLRKEK